MAEKTPFDGDNYSRAPFSDEDLAKHRHMYSDLQSSWPSLLPLVQIAQGGSRLARVIAVLSIIGGAIAVLVKQGVFL
jgi:hypothetical protein